MLASVLIPNYNYEQYLEKSLESVVSQSFQDIELVIVDDGSSDNSRELITQIVEKHKDRFQSVQTFFLEKNYGKIHALNLGISKLKGSIVTILDSDDYLADNFLTYTIEKLVELNKADPDVAFVYSDCWLVDFAGTLISQGRSNEFDHVLLKTASYIPECAPTFTSVIKSILPLDTGIRIGTKHHKWRRIVAGGWKGVYLNSPLFYYRMHHGNLSGIGKKVLNEIGKTNPEARILSGYWLDIDKEQSNGN
jgi:glycosyltransferase involved in cell wall biosynthesis